MDEEEREALIEKSKRKVRETINVGAEVLKSLQGDMETINRVKGTHERLQNEIKKAESSLGKIERKKLFEFAFVCLVLFLVITAITLLILKVIFKLF